MFISRQKAVLTATLCLAVGISPTGARADNSVIKSDEQLVYTLHTHLYPSSPSLPSRSEIKLAAVCFVTDMSECEDNIFGNSSNPPDYDFNPRDRCFNEGFIYASCPDGYKLGGKKCPYGPSTLLWCWRSLRRKICVLHLHTLWCRLRLYHYSRRLYPRRRSLPRL